MNAPQHAAVAPSAAGLGCQQAFMRPALVKEAWVDNNRHSKYLISNTYLAIPALLSSSPDNKLPDSASAMVGLV